ncbi:hypothetical protein Ciccas_005374 [Cichlidogyrus casuarinus]|uniref:Uncharacterized protein n=1 Tax=Cichlidogyrus casuarinus TaxID=1844966 RepID=A0ABD2Q9T3_9PLAT
MKKLIVHKILYWSLGKCIKEKEGTLLTEAEIKNLLKPLYVKVGHGSDECSSKEVQVEEMELRTQSSTQTLTQLSMGRIKDTCDSSDTISDLLETIEMPRKAERKFELLLNNQRSRSSGVESTRRPLRLPACLLANEQSLQDSLFSSSTEASTSFLFGDDLHMTEPQSCSLRHVPPLEHLDQTEDELSSTLHVCASLATDEIPVSEGVQCDRSESIAADTRSSASIIPYLPDLSALPLISDLATPRGEDSLYESFDGGDSARF